jgi:hypothetical protein
MAIRISIRCTAIAHHFPILLFYKKLFCKYCRYEQQQAGFIRFRNVQVMYIYQTHGLKCTRVSTRIDFI